MKTEIVGFWKNMIWRLKMNSIKMQMLTMPLQGMQKAAFKKLLQKWDEIFQRESIFDELKNVKIWSGCEVYSAQSFKIMRAKDGQTQFLPDEMLSYETSDGKKLVFSFKEHETGNNSDEASDDERFFYVPDALSGANRSDFFWTCRRIILRSEYQCKHEFFKK